MQCMSSERLALNEEEEEDSLKGEEGVPPTLKGEEEDPLTLKEEEEDPLTLSEDKFQENFVECARLPSVLQGCTRVTTSQNVPGGPKMMLRT